MIKRRHASKRLRLVGGLDVLADTMDCVYLDVDICGEINTTTTLEILAMTAEEYPDLKSAKTEVHSIQQWKTNVVLEKIVYDTKIGEILDPLAGRARLTQGT